jgi:hypothetical protein
VLDCLSFLIAQSAPSFLSFPPKPVFSLLLPTSKSLPHFSFSCTFSPQVLWNSLLYLDSLILSLPSCLSLYLCPFHSALHSSIFLLLSVFPLLHWHTRSSLLLRVLFLFSPLSLSAYSSCTLLSTHLKDFFCILSSSPVPSFSIMLSNIIILLPTLFLLFCALSLALSLNLYPFVSGPVSNIPGRPRRGGS